MEYFPNELSEKDNKVGNPWKFSDRPYDKRSSDFTHAGYSLGVGKVAPRGTLKPEHKNPIPRTKTVMIDEGC